MTDKYEDEVIQEEDQENKDENRRAVRKSSVLFAGDLNGRRAD